jgi:hypothetical protein
MIMFADKNHKQGAVCRMSITEKAKENKLDIKKIENDKYIAALAAGQAAMCEYLEKLDNALGESRDSEGYRTKGNGGRAQDDATAKWSTAAVNETADKDGRKKLCVSIGSSAWDRYTGQKARCCQNWCDSGVRKYLP